MVDRARPTHTTQVSQAQDSKAKVTSDRKAGSNALGVQAQLPASAARASASTPRPSVGSQLLRALGLGSQSLSEQQITQLFVLKAGNFERTNKVKLPDDSATLAKEFLATGPKGNANQMARLMDVFIASQVPSLGISGKRNDDKAAQGGELARHQRQVDDQRQRDVAGLKGRFAAQPRTAESARHVESSRPAAEVARHHQIKSLLKQEMENLDYTVTAYDLDKLAAKFIEDHQDHDLGPDEIREEFGRSYGMNPQKLEAFRHQEPPPDLTMIE